MSVPQFHSYRCRDRLVNVVSVYLEQRSRDAEMDGVPR